MKRHHIKKRLQTAGPLQPSHLFIVAGVSGIVSVIALRHNFQTMTKLRSAVYTADEKNGDVEGALKSLREHIYSHMNTDLTSGTNTIYPPIQLKYRYDRLVAAQQADQSNSQMYSEAQAYCEQQNPTDFSGKSRVPCIKDYVEAHGVKAQTTIPESLYKFDFVSPRWSPDVAGWSLVIAAVLCAAGLVMLIRRRIAK
ncbi:MAG: hypothetical protein JWM37_47 [Candidatus Saccharibacteria bacterium]|nr:hypothetical protein [Candidatus Saccharibacteria bacterium]